MFDKASQGPAMEANGEFQFGVKVVKYIQRRIDFCPRFFSVSTLDSTGGMTLSILGGGTYSLSLESLLDILADTEANGGANTTFDPGVSAGSAVVSIAPTEEISVSISDAAGRSVMSAQLQAHNGTTPLAIVNWSCKVYDQEVNISGFGDVIETRSVNWGGCCPRPIHLAIGLNRSMIKKVTSSSRSMPRGTRPSWFTMRRIAEER